MRHLALLIAAVLVTSAAAAAQTPSVVNGTLEAHAIAGSLEREFDTITKRVTGPAWIGYAVPVPARGRDSGCWSSDGPYAARPIGPLKLEGPDSLFVLYRIADRRIDRIRLASSECPLDAGGLTVYWLTGVTSGGSLDWLAKSISADSTRRLESSAMTAIALHGDPATDRLITFARESQDPRVRADALFWLGQRAGDKAAGTIADAIDRDPDTDVKKKAVFALSLMPKDEGVPKLIELARSNRNAAVRRQAMFWLGQSGDPRALRFFEEVLRK
jgi:hypothetical protein